MRNLLYSQTKGRRATDKPDSAQWKFDWWKLIILPALGWATWVTIHGFMAEKNKETLDLQVGVLHQRIEAQEQIHKVDDQKIRQWILDKILDLQKEIYTHDGKDSNQSQSQG